MTVNSDDLLNRMKDLLKDEMTVIAHDTWIKPLRIKSIEGNVITFIVASDTQQDFVENKYRDLIANTLRYITNKDWVIKNLKLMKKYQNFQKKIKDFQKRLKETELL